MYTVLVAADVFGNKMNYEMPFLAVPSMGELNRKIQDVFGGECVVRRPPHVPPAYAFQIQRIQIFDEHTGIWVDLTNSGQLNDGCQLYAFQPDSAYHREVQTTLPAAVPLPVQQPHSAPPVLSGSAAVGGAAATPTPPTTQPQPQPPRQTITQIATPYKYASDSVGVRSPTTATSAAAPNGPIGGIDLPPTSPSPVRGYAGVGVGMGASRHNAPTAGGAAAASGVLHHHQTPALDHTFPLPPSSSVAPLPSSSLQQMLAHLHDLPPVGGVGVLPQTHAHPVPPTPPVPTALPLPPIETSLDEKTRVIFDEIGDKVTGLAPLSDFGALLKTLRIELPPGIHLSDLFAGVRDILPHSTSISPARGMLSPGGTSAAGSGSVTYTEFVRFAEKYPTLTDALFSRCRQFWVEVKHREDVATAAKLLDTLRATFGELCDTYTAALGDVNAREAALRSAEVDLSNKEVTERDSQQRVAQCREDREQVAADVRRREEAVTRCQEQARSSNAELAEAQRQVHYFSSLAQGKDLEVRRAEEKVRELERLLREAQGELDGRRIEADTARAEVHAAEAREHEKAAQKIECDRLTAAEDQQLALAEKALVTYREREHEAETQHVGHQEAAVQARGNLYTVQQDVGVVKERSSRAKIDCDDAKRRVEDQEEAIRAMEAEASNAATNARRVEQEEQPLLEQELHLRAQRAALELKETQLRTQHCNFQLRNSARAGILNHTSPAR